MELRGGQREVVPEEFFARPVQRARCAVCRPKFYDQGSIVRAEDADIGGEIPRGSFVQRGYQNHRGSAGNTRGQPPVRHMNTKAEHRYSAVHLWSSALDIVG
jgi:hypothetical protein